MSWRNVSPLPVLCCTVAAIAMQSLGCERVPSDSRLIERFQQNREAFERMVQLARGPGRDIRIDESPGGEIGDLMERTHIREIRVGIEYGYVELTSYKPFEGGEKGYCYWQLVEGVEQPHPGVVSSLDGVRLEPGQRLYRSLGDGWYLYYEAPLS